MICEMGGNLGLGIDPGYVPGRFGEISKGHVGSSQTTSTRHQGRSGAT